MSPGVILGGPAVVDAREGHSKSLNKHVNESFMMEKVVFEDVVVVNPGVKPWGDEYYKCENVKDGMYLTLSVSITISLYILMYHVYICYFISIYLSIYPSNHIYIYI